MFEIAGMRIHYNDTGNDEIFISPNKNVFDLFFKYFHEHGHILGEKISFRKKEVLTPQELETARISLSMIEESYLLFLFIFASKTKDQLKMRGIIKQIAERILACYTKGNWNPDSVPVVHEIPIEVREFLLGNSEKGINSARVKEDLTVELKSTKEGRNEEISSITVETDCMKILRNSLRFFQIEQEPSFEEGSSHDRAQKLITYIRKRGGTVPSTYDVQTK